MEKKGKLELTWTGKYLDSKLEPRILIEMENKSVYGDINQNMLIHGDNFHRNSSKSFLVCSTGRNRLCIFLFIR